MNEAPKDEKGEKVAGFVPMYNNIPGLVKKSIWDGERAWLAAKEVARKAVLLPTSRICFPLPFSYSQRSQRPQRLLQLAHRHLPALT